MVLDRPDEREGSGEQRKMEETGCDVTCVALTTLVLPLTTLAVKG